MCIRDSEYLEPGVSMLVLETALPVKFSKTIQEALGDPPPRPAAFVDIESLPQRTYELAAEVDVIKAFIRENT